MGHESEHPVVTSKMRLLRNDELRSQDGLESCVVKLKGLDSCLLYRPSRQPPHWPTLLSGSAAADFARPARGGRLRAAGLRAGRWAWAMRDAWC